MFDLYKEKIKADEPNKYIIERNACAKTNKLQTNEVRARN